MKKLKKVFLAVALMSCMLVMQGCSYEELTTPVTSHELTSDESNNYAFHVELKADLTQGYKWYVYSTQEIDEADSKYHEGLLNDTYTSKYKYIVREPGEFDLYLILVKDGNLETARIYPFEMTVTDSSEVSFTEMMAYNLNTDKKLMKTLSNTLDLTAE
ncbi:MAG: hypothetical protein HDR00_11865 [Lachnospiraceae bacterium]|nr:hypothetical protein [Lachnospiraceae bacterium]